MSRTFLNLFFELCDDYDKICFCLPRRTGKTWFMKTYCKLNPTLEIGIFANPKYYNSLGMGGTYNAHLLSVLPEETLLRMPLNVIFVDEAAYIHDFKTDFLLKTTADKIYVFSTPKKGEKEFRSLFENDNEFYKFKMSLPRPDLVAAGSISEETHKVEFLAEFVD